MINLIIVRHGQSIADLERRYAGRIDYELTELGLKEANELSKWIYDNYTLDMIYSSSLKRASKTAEIIKNKSEIDIQYNDDLLDWNNGVLAGLNKKEASVLMPRPLGGRNPYEAILNGESLIEFRERVERFILKVINDNKSCECKNICIITHNLVINMLFRSFLQLPFIEDISIKTESGALHIWQIGNDNKRSILLSNLKKF